MKRTLAGRILFFVALFISGSVLAHDSSAISSCQTISAPGTYTLTQDVSATGTCFTINSSGVTIDGAGYTAEYVAGSGVGYGVNNTGFNNIVIKNLNLVQVNSSVLDAYGIYASGMAGSTIQNNNVTTNGESHGIYLVSASNSNTISGNRIATTGSYADGIRLSSSNSNTLSNNVVNVTGWGSDSIYLISSNSTVISGNTIITDWDDSYGIHLQTSTNSTITGNAMNTKNDYAIYIEPTTTSSYYNHTIGTSNTEGGYPISYYYKRSAAIQGLNNVGQLYVADSPGVLINNVSIVGDGITLALSANARINGSTVNVPMAQDQVSGIYLHSGSNSVTISNNTISSGGFNGRGIHFRNVQYANVTQNAISTSQAYAIYIEPTTTPSYYNHTIDTSNKEYGNAIYYYYAKTSPFTIQDLVNVGQLYVANSSGILVRNVSVVNDGITFGMTQNSNITTSAITAHGGVFGILLHSGSYGNLLFNNTIIGGGGGGGGVYLWSSGRNIISKNRINTTSAGSWMDYGITLRGGSDFNSVSDNSIVTFGDYSYGIHADRFSPYSSSNNVTGNSIITLGTRSYGVYLPYSNNNLVSGNNIRTSNTNSYGIYLTSATTNTVSDNIINTSGTSSSGIYLSSSNSNTLSNNTIVTSNTTSYGIYLLSSDSNNVSSSTISTQQSYEYYLRNASATNNFTDMNFAASMSIYFYDRESYFNYNNGTGDDILWLRTNVLSAPVTVNRTISNWNSTYVRWNDTANVVANYTLAGLLPNVVYIVYNTSNGVQTSPYILMSDANGAINFNISLSGNTEIKVMESAGLMVDCGVLATANTYYLLTKSVSSAGTCFTIRANNITLDGQGYTVTYAQSVSGYAVNDSGGFDNATIKNLKIVQGSSTTASSYAIYGSGMMYGNITNNTITTLGASSHGIYLVSSSNSNSVSANTVTASGASAYGLRLDSSTLNTFTGGSFVSASYDYYLLGAGTTNTFTNTNFTASRDIYFADTTSWFAYRNDTGTLWLKTRASAAGSITRTLSLWGSVMKWNDSAPSLTANYNLTGLLSDALYNVTNVSSSGSTTRLLSTDTFGALEPFAVALAGNTEISVREYVAPPATTPANAYISEENIVVVLGHITQIFVTVSNSEPVPQSFPLHIGSFDQSKNWAWFDGHRTDENRYDINMTLGPYGQKTVVIRFFGLKPGSYSLSVGPDVDYNNRYDDVSIQVIYANKGLFSTTPDIGAAAFALAVLVAAMIAAAGKKEKFM